jgi:hypothetical protein
MIESISQSSFGMFLRCPQQFERRYMRGEIIPPGIAARRGAGVHKAAQINHEQKIKSLIDLPVTDLQDAARDHYVKLVKEEGVFIPKDRLSEKNALLAEGLDAATKLTKLYREALAPQIMPALVEQKLSIDAGLPLPILGIVDVLTDTNWLPDLKTADKSKGAAEAENSLQLTFYAGLVADHIGKWPEKVSLEILVNNKEPKLQSLATTRGPDDWANLMLRLQLFCAQLETGLFPPCDPGAWVCSPTWCGYFWTCKYSIKGRG